MPWATWRRRGITAQLCPAFASRFPLKNEARGSLERTRRASSSPASFFSLLPSPCPPSSPHLLWLQERLLRLASTAECLGLLGAFGSAVSLAQLLLLERSELLSLAAPAPAGGGPAPPALWSAAVVGPACGFSLALFAFYSLAPGLLRGAGAGLLNLSLLTSDLYTAAARLLFFGGFAGGAGCSHLFGTGPLAPSLRLPACSIDLPPSLHLPRFTPPSAASAGWFAASLAAVVGGLVLYGVSGDVVAAEPSITTKADGSGRSEAGGDA